jgi:hypothetical protein
MKKCRSVFIAFLLFACFVTGARAQTRNSLVLGKDHLMLQLDLRSSKTQLDSILKAAGVKNANSAAISKGDFSSLARDGWNIGKRDKNTVRFERPLTGLNTNPQNPPYQITTNLAGDIDAPPGRPGYPADELYGVNKFMQVTVFELPSGLTRFYLPGYLNAKRVLLSGNFNNWSTLKGVMAKTDSGWVADVKLAPGGYEYKYIINGRWQRDKSNLQQRPDGFNDVNSVYYHINHTFALRGFPDAHKVTVAGSFNNWNIDNIPLQKKGKGWEAKLYLRDGTHTYRFWVDGEWYTDPANPTKVKDKDGHTNSVINQGEAVAFKLDGHKDAKAVYVAGTFNNWKPNEISLKKTATGWGLSLVIPPGNYGYKFIVDGNWITDPKNQLYAVEGGVNNSFIAVKPNYTFRLKGHAKAGSVHLTGNFNDWDPSGFAMAHNGDEWTISLYLKPGKYRYKFLVDGKWILDPANKLYEQNEYNTGNSVLWVEE